MRYRLSWTEWSKTEPPERVTRWVVIEADSEETARNHLDRVADRPAFLSNFRVEPAEEVEE